MYVASVVSEVRGILYVSLFIAKFRHLASSYNLHCPPNYTLQLSDTEGTGFRANTDFYIYFYH